MMDPPAIERVNSAAVLCALADGNTVRVHSDTYGGGVSVRDRTGTHMGDFPSEASMALAERQTDRFAEKVGEYGTGANWRECDPLRIVGDARRKLIDAAYSIDEGDTEAALTALADACNYAAFAADITMEGDE